jgi:hypothetical protein
MKKIILSLLAFGVSAMSFGQQALSAKDMVGIAPMVCDVMSLPADAQKSLGTKLTQMVTQNGFGATSGQFVLTANVVTLDKQATATAPVQYIVKQEVALFVVDLVDNVVIDEMSFEVQGIDRLENKAVIQGINQIKPRSTEVKAFMESSRAKIIDYYNARIPALLTKAQTLADQSNYYEALSLLSGIPECVDQYPQVAAKMSEVYKKMIDREAQAAILEAKGYIANRNYEAGMDALLAVDPASSHYREAMNLIQSVKSTIDAREQAAIARQLQRYEDQKEADQRYHDDAVMLEHARIQMTKEVGVAHANANTSLGTKLKNWFTGKFR